MTSPDKAQNKKPWTSVAAEDPGSPDASTFTFEGSARSVLGARWLLGAQSHS